MGSTGVGYRVSGLKCHRSLASQKDDEGLLEPGLGVREEQDQRCTNICELERQGTLMSITLPII